MTAETATAAEVSDMAAQEETQGFNLEVQFAKLQDFVSGQGTGGGTADIVMNAGVVLAVLFLLYVLVSGKFSKG